MTKARAFLSRLRLLIPPLALSFFLVSALTACDEALQESEVPGNSGIESDGASSPLGDLPAAGNIPANPDAVEIVAQPPKVRDTPDSTPEPSEKPESTGSSNAELDLDGPGVPLRESVDDEFFSDAAFVGNSLVEGFGLYSGLKTCDIYAATSMSVAGVGSANVIKLNDGGLGTIYQGVAQKQYGKIYILLGINEIGYVTSSFKEMYSEMLDTIFELQPDADIYIMSLTPVSAHKSSTDTTFSMSRITEYNEALYELASEKGCYYIDLVDALSDDTGYLPSSVTSDGVHFSADHYKVWLEYLQTHYI